jgi:predicted nucleic acid-binding protein
MTVVSNTSPLTNLAAIGRFDLLQGLYHQLHIAQGVWDELNAEGKHWPGRDEVAEADWIEQHPVQNVALVTALQRYNVGVLGVLLEAKARGMIGTVRPYLDALRQTAGFYLTASLYQYTLTLAGESNG